MVGRLVSFLGWPIFRCYVTFREGSSQEGTLYTVPTFKIQAFWRDLPSGEAPDGRLSLVPTKNGSGPRVLNQNHDIFWHFPKWPPANICSICASRSKITCKFFERYISNIMQFDTSNRLRSSSEFYRFPLWIVYRVLYIPGGLQMFLPGNSYIPSQGTFEDDFSFPQVGYVSSLGVSSKYLKNTWWHDGFFPSLTISNQTKELIGKDLPIKVAGGSWLLGMDFVLCGAHFLFEKSQRSNKHMDQNTVIEKYMACRPYILVYIDPLLTCHFGVSVPSILTLR